MNVLKFIKGLWQGSDGFTVDEWKAGSEAARSKFNDETLARLKDEEDARKIKNLLLQRSESDPGWYETLDPKDIEDFWAEDEC